MQLDVTQNYVRGWSNVFVDVRPQILSALQQNWIELHNEEYIHSTWDTPSIVDIIVYVSVLLRHRRRKQQNLSRAMKHVVSCLHDGLFPWLADKLDSYVAEVYSVQYNVHLPPTSLCRKRGIGRQYTIVDPGQKFDLLEQAKTAYVCPDMIQRLRTDDMQLRRL